MITSNSTSRSKIALLALGCALALVALPAARAAGPETMQPLADKAAPSLPVTTTFEKVTTAEPGPPYVLKIKNDSKATLKVSAKILLSVAFHATDKARNVPAHAIEAGQAWTIAELAANDKITLSAEGFAPMQLTVP